MAAGPDTLVTVMQAWLVTVVVQVDDLAEAGPHGPLPVALKKSLLGPQVVTVIVTGPNATPVCEGMVALLRIVTTLTPPLAFVTESVTFSPVRAALPQLDTETESA